MMIGTRERVRSSRHTSIPDIFGSMTSSSTSAGFVASKRIDGFHAVGRGLDEETLALQRDRERVAVRLLVVDDEDQGRVGHQPASVMTPPTGARGPPLASGK